MADSNKSEQSQSQGNVVSDIHFGDGDNSFTFAPVQIGTQIQTQIIQVPVEKVLQQELIKASPYQGLRRFNTKDSSRFFGRATAIADLRETVNHNSLTLVLGASGSGKSSLVRAGLMPSITAALDLQTFYGFVFTPTQDPFDAFYRCLRSEEKDYSYSASEAQIALEAQEDTFQKVIDTLKQKEERWLIFIDQFEELFTVCKDEDKRRCFISSLMQVAEAGDAAVKIVLAMRADFLGQFTTRPEFRSINQENYYVVHPMYPDELRQAIEQPALQHGVVFEAGLIEQIIKDIEGQKGYLPLLQYALNLLWVSECKKVGTDGRPHIEDRTLNQETYNLLGGVRGALQKHVTEIYTNLDQEGQDSAKQIFLNLVDIVESDTGRKTVSRRAYRNEFTGEPLLNVLDTFIDEDLLVSGSDFLEEYTSGEHNSSLLQASTQISTVEIAHEVLIHSWDELRKWLEEEEEIVILRNWLANEVKRWERIRTEDSAKANAELLKGSRLEQIAEARRREAFQNIGGLRQAEHEFIDASVKEYEHQQKQEQARKRKELEAAVALETEQKRNQILDKALSEAQVTIEDAKKQRRRIIRKGLIAFAVISAATIAVSVAAVVNGQKLAKSQTGRQLEQASNSIRRQFLAGELDALIAAMENAQALKTLVKANDDISDYPTLGPLFTLHYILNSIHEENYFQGDQRQIKSVDFAPNSQRIATGGTDGTVKVWDLSGLLLSEWDSQQALVNHLAFTPNDERLITAGVDGSLQVRDLSGKLIDQWQAHSSAGVNHISVASDASTIVTAGGDGYIRRWDFSGAKQAEWKATAGTDGVLSLSVHLAEQKIMSSGDRTGTVKLWDFSGKLLETWQANQGGPTLSVALSPDGRYAATAGTEGIGRVWNLSGQTDSDQSEKSLASATELIGHTGNIATVSFSADSERLVTAGQDATVRVWTLSGEQTALLQGHSALVRNARFAPDAQRLISAGNDGMIRLWNLSGSSATQFEASTEHADVNSISFNPQAPQLAVTGDDGTISLWSLSGKQQNAWQARRGKQFSISFTPDGQSLVVSGDNNRVRLWSVSGESGTLIGGHQGAVKEAVFNPDGSAIATAGADGTTRIWTPSGQEIAQFSGHDGEVTSVSFSENARQVASAGDDGTVRLWDIATNTQKALLPHPGKVNSVVFAPDGRQIASAGDNGEIRIWDADSGDLVRTFSTFQTAINRIRYSPDGLRIASAGADSTVKVWDTSGRQLYELDSELGNEFNHESKDKRMTRRDPFWDLAFSPDGSSLAAASGSLVYLWPNQDLDGLLAEGCQWLALYRKGRTAEQETLSVCQEL